MKAENYWQLFLETGAPEAYLMYSRAKRMECTHVLEGKGIGDSCHGLS